MPPLTPSSAVIKKE